MQIGDLVGFFLYFGQLDIFLQIDTQKLIQGGAQNSQLLNGVSFALHRLGQCNISFEYVVRAATPCW